MVVGLALLIAALILRAGSSNRHVQGRLLGSIVAFAAYTIVAAGFRYHILSGGLEEPLQLIGPLLAAFGVVNALVALAINPWRADRMPDRFPTIVQDAIVIALFAVAATAILKERVFTTTAVGAVVIGFALQDTLGNLFAGLAIQIEKPFRVGHWVHVGDIDGLVSQVTWRATKVRTKDGNFVIVPNSVVARDAIMNYSEPSPETRIQVDVGVTYDVPPNDVKAVIRAAIRDEPLLSPSRQPEVLLLDFGGSAIIYRIWVWTTEFAADEYIKDRVRTSVYYAFRRKGISIPYPIQVQIEKEEEPIAAPDPSKIEHVLQGVSIFSSLADEQRAELARAARQDLYAAGEIIVRQGAAGSSMFIIASGEAVVSLEPSNQEVARIPAGGFFGEMSLLTGDPRNATVRTAVDSELLEITVDDFRRFVLAHPATVELIGQAVATRRAELERHAAAASELPAEPPQRFLNRVRRFLHLSTA